MIAGSSGIAGSATIGDRVVIGGMVGIADHKKVGDDAIVAGKAGVGRDVEPRSVYTGYPARRIKEQRSLEMDQLRIGRALRRLRSVTERVDRLEAAADGNEEGEGGE